MESKFCFCIKDDDFDGDGVVAAAFALAGDPNSCLRDEGELAPAPALALNERCKNFSGDGLLYAADDVDGDCDDEPLH